MMFGEFFKILWRDLEENIFVFDDIKGLFFLVGRVEFYIVFFKGVIRKVNILKS